MGNMNSPEHSPDRSSRPRRLLSNSPKNKSNNETPIFEKPRIIRNLSKINKILSKPKNIMTFISQAENFILLKSMNDSTNIGFNHLNILIENTFNNPFLEDQIKYLQIVDDSIDKKILGKLNNQSRENNQKQMENLINNLLEINDISNNNINIGNISSIHKKNGKFLSREESPLSQRDDELDLTSFSTTIGGKISPTASNYNKNQNSKQIKTFKIKKKNGLIIDGNYNSTNNNINYKNISSRQDSPTSLNSINSSNNISNVLSSINATNFHSKNSSSNTSLKEKNYKKKYKNDDRNNSYNNNLINNTIIKENNYNSNNYYINNNKTNISNNNNVIKISKISNKNNNIISKKVVKKTLITPQKKNSGPIDNTKSPRKSNINNDINKTTKNILSNIDNNNNTSYMQNNLSNIDNNNDLSIQNNLNNLSNLSNNNNLNNNKKCENNNKKIKIGFTIPKLNIIDDNRTKSPNSIINNKIKNTNNIEEENENSQIIFNNVRTLTDRNNYSYSNNNSSMINNMSSLNQNSKINNTNIIDDKKYIKILNDSDSAQLKTEPNKDINSYSQITTNKKKVINEKNKNPFKTKTYKIQGKINQLNYRNIRKVEGDKHIRLNTINIDNINNNILSKENKTIDNEDKINKATSNKKIQRKEGSLENIQKKNDISKCAKNIIKKKVNVKNKNIIINTKKLDLQNNLKTNVVSKNNITKENNNIINNKKQDIKKKKEILFDDNLDNINFLDEELQNTSDIKNDESKKPILNTEEIFNKKKLKPKKNITIENKTIDIDEIKNKNINININNNNITKNSDENKNKIKKKIVKKPKKQKINNLVFNIDLSNDKDDKKNMGNNNISDDNKSKSEDISDNSLSHEEKIQINNLEGKIGKPLKDKNNIINNDNKIDINKKKIFTNNTQNKINKNKDKDNKFISFDTDKNKVNIEKNKINAIINNKKKPKLIKETNNQNSKINRLVFENKDNNYDHNDDDLDDVCNFSGINNKSYTNICDYNYKNDIFNDFLDEDLKRAHSPKIIIHKKINFDLNKTDNIDLKKNKFNINNNNNKENDNNDIFQNININKIQLQESNNNDNINMDVQSKAINIIKNKCNIIKDNNYTNILSKNVSNYSNDNFSFKVKNNEQLLYNSKKALNNIEKENKQLKNESIIESRASSKFSFKINDDIHESEFNDIDFLD